jgi:hypothetical protein
MTPALREMKRSGDRKQADEIICTQSIPEKKKSRAQESPA